MAVSLHSTILTGFDLSSIIRVVSQVKSSQRNQTLRLIRLKQHYDLFWHLSHLSHYIRQLLHICGLLKWIWIVPAKFNCTNPWCNATKTLDRIEENWKHEPADDISHQTQPWPFHSTWVDASSSCIVYAHNNRRTLTEKLVQIRLWLF